MFWMSDRHCRTVEAFLGEMLGDLAHWRTVLVDQRPWQSRCCIQMKMSMRKNSAVKCKVTVQHVDRRSRYHSAPSLIDARALTRMVATVAFSYLEASFAEGTVSSGLWSREVIISSAIEHVDGPLGLLPMHEQRLRDREYWQG